MNKLFIPRRYAEPPPMRKLAIRPASSPDEFVWLCPECRNPNTMRKDVVSDNRSFSCWDCGYTWTIGIVPDDIKYFLRDTRGESDVNQRPRIVRQ